MAEENSKPVYCMHCARWYAPTQANQCDLEEKFESNPLSSSAIGFVIKEEKTKYGKPSELNQNHDCTYYKDIGLLRRLGRNIFYGIPMKPILNN